MVKVGKLADYALVVLHFLARHMDMQPSMKGIAEGTGLPLATVRKLMKFLVDAGLVLSRRGPQGGYQLSKPLDSVSVLEIITAVEGPVELTECCAEACGCDLVQSCDLSGTWPTINHLLVDVLGRITLGDLQRPGGLDIKTLLAGETDVSVSFAG